MKAILFTYLLFLSVSAKAQLYSRETNNNTIYTDSTAKKEILTLYNLILNGQDFSDIAFKYSQDPGSYKQGGELRPTAMNEYVYEYREAVFKLSLNEISKPFKSEYGYHIVQLIAKKDSVYISKHILLRVD
jgi:parvulin-like peptidyl-prolyl isomerase